MPLIWTKRLSISDAQQPTSGRLLRCLRLTKSGNPYDTTVWFRRTFFGSEAWYNTVWGSNPVEQCDVKFHVTLGGQHYGIRQMSVTYDPHRIKNKSTPTTYIHYDDQTQEHLERNNYIGRIVTLRSDAKGTYEFLI